MLTLTFGLVTREQKGEIGGEGQGRGEGGKGTEGEVGVKGPGIRRVLLFRRLVQPPRYAISAEARGVYRRCGRAQRGRGEDGGWKRLGYARAVVWMRELGFDPKSETEIEGTRRSREGAGGREGAAMVRRGEERSEGEREARGLDGLDSPARRY